MTTAVAVVAATGLYLLYAQNRADKSKIPSELLRSPHAAELKMAVRLAKMAGQNMKGYIETKGTSEASNYSLDIDTKSNAADFCTKVDVQNENMIMAAIQEAFPTYEIIGEETTGTGEIPKLTKKPTFIIDPIDGESSYESACRSVHKNELTSILFLFSF